MMRAFDSRLERLNRLLESDAEYAVAFSGERKSGLLLELAACAGRRKPIAITAFSGLLTKKDMERAVRFAASVGAWHYVAEPGKRMIEEISHNSGLRCYYCMHSLYKAIRMEANRIGVREILDGGIAETTEEGKHKMRALGELGIKSPFAEAGISMDDINHLIRVYEKSGMLPESRCTAHSIEYGVPISENLLKSAGQAKDAMLDSGLSCSAIRISDRHSIRISVHHSEIAAFLSMEKRLRKSIEKAGFRNITIESSDIGKTL